MNKSYTVYQMTTIEHLEKRMIDLEENQEHTAVRVVR